MLLKEYMHHLENLLEDHPEAAEYKVIYSKDDEGNGYDPVYFTPGVCHYDAGEMYTEEQSKEHEFSINAVILN